MSNTYWLNGKYINKEDAYLSPLTHTLHYGLGAFEGVRSYGSSNGDNVNIFRLKEHTERLFESAKIINVPINHNIDEVMEAQIGVISKSNLKDAYIRPLLYLNDERLGLDIVGMSSHLMISCWDWPTYFGAESIEQGIDVMISSFTRQFPNSLMTKSKISGGYVNGVMAHDQAKNNGYQEAILLDTNGFVAEGSGQNIFIVKDGNLLTPELTCCLNGITRRSVIQIAKDKGIDVQERQITRDELYTADEIFFSGTAVEITPIRSVDKVAIGPGKRGEITTVIQETYSAIVRGEAKEYDHWLSRV
ncbi:MAG: branched-chain amino acid transaminase [SAR202 cluster bacterium]|nr:branched-chain amino acid transaminase [SAR202 cluster bacterium]|tara:strand:+ start:1 stop:912 length:912 start_codon:yes stop_codon:yes gene_type:complete